MGVETPRWDVADHLDNADAVLAYLEAVFEDGDPELIAAALNDVARACGHEAAADLDAGVGLDAVIRSLKTLGLKMTAKAA